MLIDIMKPIYKIYKKKSIKESNVLQLRTKPKPI